MSQMPAAIKGRVIAISIAAAMGGFLFGFDTAVITARSMPSQATSPASISMSG